MPLVPILSSLLRVLLCLSLVFTGWADALAMASMGAGAPDRSLDSGPPCHGDPQASERGVPEGDNPAMHDGGNCCSGACDCPCAHAPVALILAMPPAGTIHHAAYAAAAQPHPGAPLLRHLIRPPIG